MTPFNLFKNRQNVLVVGNKLLNILKNNTTLLSFKDVFRHP